MLPKLPEGPKRPFRIRGVRVEREIAIIPESDFPEPPTEDTEKARYEAWQAQWGGGTLPEFLAFDYLENIANLVPFEDFQFQSSQLGGRKILGGFVVDFEISAKQVFWRIQGLFFHQGNIDTAGRDALGKQVIETATGWKVVDLFENDLYERRNYVCSRGLEGIQVTGLSD